MGHPGRSLSAREAAIYAAGVADIDGLFRSLVSERRNLAPEELDSLAGGIPWSGRRALETGLADLNGGLSDAVSAAAGLAGLEEWNTVYFEPGEDPRTELLGRILFGYRKRPGVRLIR
jgi:protease-4